MSEELPSSDLVVVTGASGFVALHCVVQLLQAGYRVRGTLRDLSREESLRSALGQALKSDPVELLEGLTFCRCDLVEDTGWDEALLGARYLLHVASPVPAEVPRDEQAVIRPAQEGTLRVLQAAHRAGIERVVLTSSIAAIMSSAERTPGRIFDEEDWSDLAQPLPPYQKSKTLAETAAWEYVRQLPPEARLELTVLNPAFVIGPSVSGTKNTSNEIVRKLLDRQVPGVPRLIFPLVDVRDVAQAHVLAMTHPQAPGQRFILSGEELWFADIARVLNEAGHKVPGRVMPNWFVHVYSWFDPIARLILPDLGWEMQMSSDKARTRLGWKARPPEDSIRDTAESILARRR